MKFIDKLERKFGRFGIPNLTIYMIVCYVIGYALMIVNPGILNWLSLEPAYICLLYTSFQGSCCMYWKTDSCSGGFLWNADIYVRKSNHRQSDRTG